MATTAYAKFRAYGLDWCEAKGISPESCLLLVGRKTSLNNYAISTTICTEYFPCENTYRVEEEDAYGFIKTLVLVELGMPAANVTMPKSVEVKHNGVSAELSIVELHTTNPQETTPPPKLKACASKPDHDADLAKALTSLSVGIHYRKLRVFSGHPDQMKDEDSFQMWITQARAMVEEGDTSDVEKRRRIREALKSPALNLIEDLRRERPSATAADYLDGLEAAFGSTLTGEELYHQFLNLDQDHGESPSAYLTRLQSSLRQVLLKKGAPPSDANKVLLRQFLKGTLYDQMMLVDLHLRDKLGSPPTYLELLTLVRRQEEEYLGRSQKSKAAKASRAAHVSIHQVEDTAHETLTTRLTKVEEMLKTIATSFEHQASSNHKDQSPARFKSSEVPGNPRPRFCYKCGQDGHMKRECPNQPDPELVNRKLISHMHPGNGKRRQRWSTQMPEDQ